MDASFSHHCSVFKGTLREILKAGDWKSKLTELLTQIWVTYRDLFKRCHTFDKIGVTKLVSHVKHLINISALQT